MNKQTTAGDMYAGENGTHDSGFTLVEILIAIVLIGVLSAVAVVGVNSLTSQGSDAACEASLDAAKAASVVYFASNDNKYPVDLAALTAGTDPALELPSDAVLVAADEDGISTATVGTWTLTMTSADATTRPTFSCPES